METKSLKVVIAADNALVVNGLRHHLENNFGKTLTVSACYDVRLLLKKITALADVVLLDYFFDGINGEVLRRKLEDINPDIKVIMHSSRQDVIAEIKEMTEVQPARMLHSQYSQNLVHSYL